MIKILIFTVSIVLFAACDRPKINESTKIQIQLPEVPKISSSVAALGANAPDPSGFTGATPINCYLIAAGGPEQNMSKNSCFSKGGINTSLVGKRVGFFVGAAPAGGTMSIDVPSGKERSIYVVGFYAPDIASCRDFKTYGFPNGSLSDPFLLGEQNNLELKPGETLSLNIPVTYNSQNRIDCTGPDFPGSSGNVIPTKLSLNKDWFPYDATVENSCQSVGVRLVNDQNREGTMAVSVTIQATVNANPLLMYPDYQTCIASGATISSIVMPPNTYGLQIVFKSPLATTPLLSLIATSSSLAPSAQMNLANAVATTKGINLDGPRSILPGLCYPYNVLLMSYSGAAISETTLTSMNYNAGSGFNFYSNGSCSTVLSTLNIPAFTSSYPVFGKINVGSGISGLNLTMTGYAASALNIYEGSGGSTPTFLEVRGDNMGPANGICYAKPYRASLFNESRAAVTAAAALPFNFVNASVNFDFHSDSSCTSLISGSSFAVGMHSADFYIKPKSVGAFPISITGPGLQTNPYIINVSP